VTSNPLELRVRPEHGFLAERESSALGSESVPAFLGLRASDWLPERYIPIFRTRKDTPFPYTRGTRTFCEIIMSSFY